WVGAGFPAFAGALIWAIHPMKVESVVWISGRKDVLCGMFYVAALIAYSRTDRSVRATTFVFFVLALLSKGTAASLPHALLAIDFLGRRRMRILEKLPFFAMSILFGVIGFIAQRVPGPFAEAQPSLSLATK